MRGICSASSPSTTVTAGSTTATCPAGTSANWSRESRSCRAPITSICLSSAARPDVSRPLSRAGATCRRRSCAASKEAVPTARPSASTAPAICELERDMSEAYERVFDPRGRVDVERIAPAPCAATLEGLRLGILDNTKWNANRLLRKTADRLGEQQRFAVVHYYKKESFSKNADTALLEQIDAENEILLTAIGD